MPKRKVSNLPSHYKEGIRRVSDIVEVAYPFEGTESQKWFRKWLHGKGISEEEYMQEASEAGTYIHKQLENYLNKKPLEQDNRYADLVINGIEAIEELGIKPIHTEHYICTDEYQGSIDAVVKIKNKEWIIDFKSWAIAKQKFGVENKYRKPTDKLKKATLQLSLYAFALGIENIAVIELTTERYYFHKLTKIKDDKLKKIIQGLDISITPREQKLIELNLGQDSRQDSITSSKKAKSK